MNFSVGIDWLQGIFLFPDIDFLKSTANFLTGMVEDEIPWEDEHPWFCGVSWPHSVTSVRGLKFSWKFTEQGVLKALFVLPGSFWSRLSLFYSWDVCKILYSQGFRVTRIDIRLDDFQKQITFKDLSEAIADDNYSGVQIADIRRPKIKNLGFKGWTVYFGSSGSDKRVRFYDKFEESKGEIDSHRMEVQYRDERADFCFRSFVFCNNQFDKILCEQKCVKFLISVLVGSISFCYTNSHCRQDLRILLPWWKNFVLSISGFPKKILSLRPKPTADSRLRWLFRVSSAIVTVWEGMSNFADFWDELIAVGVSRMSETHELFIKVFKNDIPFYKRGIYSVS